ncbi:hypothetical protein ABEM52_18025, partial [Escherichia coli]
PVSISVILFNSRFRSYGAQGVLKKHPFCGAFLVFWGFKFLSIKSGHPCCGTSFCNNDTALIRLKSCVYFIKHLY